MPTKFLSLNPEDPSLEHLQPEIETHSKYQKKHKYGQISYEDYYNKENQLRYKATISLGEMSAETCQEFIRVNKPFFEDPFNPQLTLFPETNE